MNRRSSLMGGLAMGCAGCITCLMLVGIVVLTRAIKNSPDAEFRRHNTAGNDYYSEHAFKRAVAEYSEMIRVQPARDDGYLLRAMAYAKLGSWDKAIADNTTVISMNTIPKVIEDAHYNRGLDYKSKGDCRKAAADFTEVIKLNPMNVNAMINRAECYRITGDFRTSVKDIDSAMRLAAPTTSDYMIRGLDYLNLNQAAEASSDFEHATQRNPGDAFGWCDLGWSNYLMNRLDKAIVCGKRSVAISPTFPMLRFNLGLYYSVQNDWGSAEPQYRAGIAHGNKTDNASAARDIEKAIRQHPDAAATLSRAATLLKEAK